jgi:hypothetical protein
MWYREKRATKEEKQKKMAAFHALKEAEKAKAKAEEKAKVEALKRESPEEKKAEKAAKAMAAKAAKDKAKADQAKAKEERKAEKAHYRSLSPEAQKAYQAEKKAGIAEKFAQYQAKHEAEVQAKGAAYAERYDLGGRIGRFFFNVGQLPPNQAYMRWWRKLEIAHPSFSRLLYQVFYFLVFSEGVTVLQYLIMLFLPYCFASLCHQSFVWPAVPLGISDASGNPLNWAIFNEPMRDINNNITLDPSQAVVGGGLGNFIAFEIAIFLAQCINFPLQRNITFKSHGNIPWQAMWYFIGWVAISLFVNAVWGICNPFLLYWGTPKGISDLLKTFITGGISMTIFFFIFRILFPAGEAKKEDSPDVNKEMKESQN